MIASFSMALLAADAAGPQQTPGQSLWMMLGPALLVFMFIFMMSSQRKRARQQENMLKTLKSGDKVSTSSGIIGTIVTVKERSVSIRSEDSKLEVLKSAVTEVLERKGEPGEAKEGSRVEPGQRGAGSERKGEPAEAKDRKAERAEVKS